MKISPIQSTTNFMAKSQAAQRVLQQFDKDALNFGYRKASIEKQRFVLEKLMQGFEVPFLVEALKISRHKVYELSTKYNARKVYMQDRDNIILKRLLNGERRKKIANELDIDLTSVQAVADKHKTYITYRTNRDNLIKEKYLAGMTRKSIAKELNIDPETVKRALKKMGVKKS